MRIGLAGLALLAAPIGALAAQPAASETAARRGYNLAFLDADVRRVIDAVLGEMLGLDYSVDPAVTGTITLRTGRPVARQELLPLLETALRSVDAVVVPQGSTYRVLPRSAAQGRAAPPAAATAGSEPPIQGYASEVVTLKYASAREIARVLEQFLGKETVASVDEARSQLVITGSSDERAAARQVIGRFDTDALASMAYEFYKLESVDPATLAGELERVLKPTGVLGGRVRLVPLPRLRSLLVIARDRDDIGRIESWVRRLDMGVSGKRKLYSYTVQNGRARDLAAALQLVLGGGNGQGVADEPRLGEPDSSFDQAEMQDAGGGGAGRLGGKLEPSEAIGAQTPLPGTSTPIVATSGSGLRVVPNEANNSLLIYADGEEYDFIREALERLDQPVSQVLIEATLAEVTLDNELQYGVNFSKLWRDVDIFGKEPDVLVRNSSTTSGTPMSIFPGLSVSVLGSTAQAVLNTLQAKTNVRVLSAPKLVVLNNQTASLQVGDQVPIVIQQAQSVSAPGAPVVNTVELRDTGVILKVTPRVNDSGTITLDIAQEVSDVVPTITSGINSPTIQQRRLASTVATKSGQMVALGGLIRDQSSRTRSGVPILSQLPVIGAAFGNHVQGRTRTELIILLTPTIIRSPNDVRGVVDALLDGLEHVGPLVDPARRGEAGAPSRR